MSAGKKCRHDGAGLDDSCEACVEASNALSAKAGERCALERVVALLEGLAADLFIKCKESEALMVRGLALTVKGMAMKASAEQSTLLKEQGHS